MLPRIQPINPARLSAPFDHPNWLFELEQDGYSLKRTVLTPGALILPVAHKSRS